MNYGMLYLLNEVERALNGRFLQKVIHSLFHKDKAVLSNNREAIEHINQLKIHQDAMQKEIESLRAERETYRSPVNEMDRVRHQLTQNHHHQPPQQHNNRMQGIERF